MRTAGLDSSAQVTGLHPNTKYHVTVRAYNRAGTGPASPPADAMTTKPREYQGRGGACATGQGRFLPHGWAPERGWLVVKGSHGSICQGLQSLPPLPLTAPRRPPGNISWTFSSSSLSLKWDPVVPLRNESTVTGYKVRKGTQACHEEKWLPSVQWSQGHAIPSRVASGARSDMKHRGSGLFTEETIKTCTWPGCMKGRAGVRRGSNQTA